MKKIYRYSKFLNESKLSKMIRRMTIDNFEILIGRNSEGNDYLTTQLSNDNDLWFHAKGVPGSHVIIKIRKEEPSLETIKKVAYIAAENSKIEKEGDVLYTKVKNVTKNNNQKEGQVNVNYNDSKTIKVKL
jgi:predicted ribosome quality control (RQC) complex YloA/Tae2 family protein